VKRERPKRQTRERERGLVLLVLRYMGTATRECILDACVCAVRHTCTAYRTTTSLLAEDLHYCTTAVVGELCPQLSFPRERIIRSRAAIDVELYSRPFKPNYLCSRRREKICFVPGELLLYMHASLV